RVTAILEAQTDEVDRVLERINEGQARLFVVLKEDRPTKSYVLERKIPPQLQKIADARVTFASQNGGGTGRDISVMLTGSDPVVLNRTAQTLVEQMAKVPDAVAPRIAADMQRPELVIVPRLDLAAQLGVTTSALTQAIRVDTLGDDEHEH